MAGVVTCSALKRAYREVLRRPEVAFVYLEGSQELIARRLAARHGHFFRAEMLARASPSLSNRNVMQIIRASASSGDPANPADNAENLVILGPWRSGLPAQPTACPATAHAVAGRSWQVNRGRQVDGFTGNPCWLPVSSSRITMHHAALRYST